MSWFYAETGVQKGPIDNDSFAQLVRSGVITGSTLVWREGMSAWQPYHEVAPAIAPAADAASPLTGNTLQERAASVSWGALEAATCAECGGSFAKSDMVAYAGRHVCAGCRDAFFQKVREGAYAAGGPIEGPLDYASFGVRWGAKIIDGILLGVIQTILVLPLMLVMFSRLGTAGSESPEAMLWLVGLQFALYAVQFTVMILFKGFFYGRWGATPGKMALGLKVVRPDGARLRMGRAFGRAAAEILNGFTLYIGYLIAAFDEERRGLHDRICDTRVIRVR